MDTKFNSKRNLALRHIKERHKTRSLSLVRAKFLQENAGKVTNEKGMSMSHNFGFATWMLMA